MPKLKNISTGETMEGVATQDLADQGWVPVSDTSVITADSLRPEKAIDITPPPADTNNYNGIISGGLEMANQLLASTNKPSIAEAPKMELSLADQLKGLLGETPPSGVSLYEQTYGVGPTQEELTAKKETQNKAQTDLDLLNAQMQAINAEATAIPIKVEKDYAGKASSSAIEGMSREKLRDLALRSLPLEGQILAAQAVLTGSQKALEIATDKFNQVFSLRLQDIQNQYDYQKEQRDRIWDYLTTKEQQRLDKLQKEDDRKYQESRDNLKIAQDLSQQAMQIGEASLASQFTQLDPKLNTFTADLAKLQSQLAIKQSQQQLTVEKSDIINKMTTQGYSYISSPIQLTGLNESQITRIKDSTGKDLIFKNPIEKVTGKSGGEGGGGGGEGTSEFDYGRQILEANPNASDEELKVGLLENTKLNVTEINSLIAERKATQVQPDVYSEEWFNQKVSEAKKSGYDANQITQALTQNFSTDELFKVAKAKGYAKWYTGKDADIKRYIESIYNSL